MKEFTIEEKAKAYDDAIENARYYHDEMEGDICCILEDCFPELKESDDEKIKREILEYFQQFKNEGLRGINISDWIAWLEKQGEQKTTEWSKEDERLFQIIIDILYRANNLGNISRSDLIACVRKLKSLNPQNINKKDMTINVDTGKIDKEYELNRTDGCCGCDHYYDKNDTVCKYGCIHYFIKL